MSEAELQPKRVSVVTYIPSPYQVEYFNAIHATRSIQLTVYYLSSGDQTSDIARRWITSSAEHQHVFLDRVDKAVAENNVIDADLVVLNYYRHPIARRLISRLASQSNVPPWCFWGERPGVRFGGLVGRYLRRRTLSTLWTQKRPIWGIGSWAVAKFREEFGSDRLLVNLPYRSNLDRFTTAINANERHRNRQTRTILFSGSLIHRKGVDLLARSFEQIADEFPSARLSIVGTGPLESWMKKRLQPYSDRVQFHGFQQWDRLPEVYAEGDLLCVPSRYDGWAMVVPEGLASGMPVLASDQTGAAHDLIDPASSGLIFKAGNVRSLTASLRTALSWTEQELASRRDAALATASAHSLDQGVRQFIDACRESMTGRLYD